MTIREAQLSDLDAIWPIFKEVVGRGDTYAYPADSGKEDAGRLWITHPQKTYVFEKGGATLGTYYLKPNQAGPGDHVCNCGYMVSSAARGQGVATAMCLHSQEAARELGYKAMQFNFVASTNATAVRLWERLGFEIVGTLPGAFRHPEHGFVDAYVMYKWLADDAG